MKIRKWAVMFEQRLKRYDGVVEVLYGEMGKMGEGGAGEGTMGIGASLYRMKSVNARVKEIEEAVRDLEEGWKVATEVQEELREILWNNDERDFMEEMEGTGEYTAGHTKGYVEP